MIMEQIIMERNEYEKMFLFENWYWWYRGLHELVSSQVQRVRASQAPAILDAGCGTGRMMELLGAYGHIEGFDFSAAAIEFCRQRGLRDCRVLDLDEWDPETGRWDIIISLDVICCSGIHNDRIILEKFRRALVEHGILIMNLPAFALLRRAHDQAVSSVRRYRKNDLVGALAALGFRVPYAGYRLPPLFVVMGLKKMVENISPSPKIESDLRPLPRLLNDLLLGYHRLENTLIRGGVRFPFGSSLFVVAVKDAEKSKLFKEVEGSGQPSPVRAVSKPGGSRGIGEVKFDFVAADI
jgi:SAM-dependent methyltransferase